MSGHSKWATIKRKKGAADAKRGQLFSKIIKEITVAARAGGGDVNGNPRLRTVVDKAKASNMPADNITRAIKKGTGELEGVNYEESWYEGYGPGGTAVMVECLTDNKKRTVAEVRHIFGKNSGNLGEAGCVGWMFQTRGVLTFEKKAVAEEALMDTAIEAGAEDIRDLDDLYEVTTDPGRFEEVRKACEAKSWKPVEAGVQMCPKNTVKLDGEDAEKMLKLVEALEEHEDVQNVFANFDIDTKVMEKLAAA
ncbi:MAG: YebC/PmpR family DNA-binding transcriptional regulator [Deltaproteobacteria bacterium]|nr:YebC/PmpR family DNA-binding transcriptional regulator [Deltaproteobacteria bacterium]